MAVSFLNVILQKEWNLSDTQIGMVGTGIFCGFFIGSVVSGNIADKFGRRKFYMASILALFATGVISAFSPNYYFFLISRSIFGITLGILSPLTATMLIEITPLKLRGRWIIWGTSVFTLGEMFACLVAYVSLPTPTTGNWTPLVLWVTIPALFSFLLAIRYLKESPRFAVFENVEKGIEVLDYMHRVNHENRPLVIQKEDEIQLKNWVRYQLENINLERSSLASLFLPENKLITTCVWTMWFALSFVYYGVIYIVPKTLQAIEKSNNETTDDSFSQIFLSILGEIPGYFIAVWLIEHQTFGRKLTLAVSFAISGFFCLLPSFVSSYYFIACMFMVKLWISVSFSVIYPFTSEVYHTKYRTTGMGMASAASRVGGMIMPWVALYSLELSPMAPYAFYGVACLVAAVAAMMLPYDTRGRELDQIENRDRIHKTVELEEDDV